MLHTCATVYIYGIKDTYVVWKLLKKTVKKTVFGVGFKGFMGFRHLPVHYGDAHRACARAAQQRRLLLRYVKV
jgi:hypothetical protein